ncbi:MAG: translational GTPase TypA [Solitalea-like symbiont of Acarus siro]
MQEDIINIAIIAHVDHGKTTLVDKILYQTGSFKENDADGLILDNTDLERERGITIVSKNVAVKYQNTKINIIDTPGHADFGGEVERVLKMADGVLLLVDAFEGPMPQTRFVTEKALGLNLTPIVVINKVDKPNCSPLEVNDGVFELFFNLGASDQQLSFPTIYGSAKENWMGPDPNKPTDNMLPLLDAILNHIPKAKKVDGPFQMQITSIDYSSFVGKIAIGRVTRGSLVENSPVALVKQDGSIVKTRIKELYTFEGLKKVKVEKIESGDIYALAGIDNFTIGDTITDIDTPEALESIKIDEPTISMLFTINNSPFFGKEGKFVTSRHLQSRLEKETEKNLALRIEQGPTADSAIVRGRGVLQLSILIENMRREGYELQVGQPQVIIKEINGVQHEPIETLVIDTPEEYAGKIIEIVSNRKGSLISMEPKGDLQHLEFTIPTRLLMGLRSQVLTSSAGEAILTHRFKEYAPFKASDTNRRMAGVLVATDAGTATPYRIDKLQDRGRFFIEQGQEVYEGMIIGEHNRSNDLDVNITEGKQLTNFRTTSKDDSNKIIPPIKMSLEEYLEYIQADEYVEITPKNIRLRKIILKSNQRASKKKN